MSLKKNLRSGVHENRNLHAPGIIVRTNLIFAIFIKFFENNKNIYFNLSVVSRKIRQKINFSAKLNVISNNRTCFDRNQEEKRSRSKATLR